MAMPTSARASTGASFIPSPTNARTFPAGLSLSRLSTHETLSAGSRSARYSSMPTCEATYSPTSFLSPVSITVRRTPNVLSSAMADLASSFMTSETMMCPRYSPSEHTWMIVPTFSQGFQAAPASSIILELPTQTRWPLTLARTPLPAISSTFSTEQPSSMCG